MSLLDITISLFEKSGLSMPELSKQTGIAQRTCYDALNKVSDTGVSKVQTLHDFLADYVAKQKKKSKAA